MAEEKERKKESSDERPRKQNGIGQTLSLAFMEKPNSLPISSSSSSCPSIVLFLGVVAALLEVIAQVHTLICLLFSIALLALLPAIELAAER